MRRSPSDWPAVLGLAALLGVAGPACGDVRGIYRPSDYGAHGPQEYAFERNVPCFDAAVLHAGTAAHAESLATRLGFVPRRHGDRNWVVGVALGRRGRGLAWRDAHRNTSLARDLSTPVPIQTLSFEQPDPELPIASGTLPDDDPAPQPNGVFGIACMIAVVPSIDVTADHWPPPRTGEFGGGVPRLDFREHYPVPALDARACDAPGAAGCGAVRLLEPTQTDGWAAAHLDHGHGGWVGIALESTDLNRTVAWFDAHGVRYARDVVAGRATLRLDPRETDGWLIEVVGAPTP